MCFQCANTSTQAESRTRQRLSEESDKSRDERPQDPRIEYKTPQTGILVQHPREKDLIYFRYEFLTQSR